MYSAVTSKTAVTLSVDAYKGMLTAWALLKLPLDKLRKKKQKKRKKTGVLQEQVK